MLFEEAKRDSTFLSRHNINDYSFLIGVNDKKWCNKEQLEQEQYLLLSINKKNQSFESPVIRKPFYEEYRKLMYASLDLGILDREDFIDNWSSDRNKVRKMLEKYQPCPVDYQLPGGLILQCRNCYKIRDELKKRDFTWNNMEEAWEKAIKKEDKDAFLEMLKDLGCKDVEIRNEWDMHIDASIVVTANGNTYDAKEALKKRGFWFDSESKTWKRKLRSKDAGLFLETIRMADEFKNVTFTI